MKVSSRTWLHGNTAPHSRGIGVSTFVLSFKATIPRNISSLKPKGYGWQQCVQNQASWMAVPLISVSNGVLMVFGTPCLLPNPPRTSNKFVFNLSFLPFVQMPVRVYLARKCLFLDHYIFWFWFWMNARMRISISCLLYRMKAIHTISCRNLGAPFNTMVVDLIVSRCHQQALGNHTSDRTPVGLSPVSL